MIGDALFIFLGLAVLLVGGDLLVRGAVGLANALRVPALIVSLTIIAFGTSAPELVVSVAAVLEKEPGIAVGNIVGANIANILLVLGLPAIAYPMTARVPGLKRHALVLVIATAAFAAVAYGAGAAGRVTGAAFVAGIIAYVVFLGWMAKTSRARDPVIDEVAEYSDGGKPGLGSAMAYLVAGLIGLPIGADILVVHGSAFATALGARPETIGLTVVAFGTSLPELATVAAAALRKRSEVAIGNVIGSNIFNIFAVGGAAGLAGGFAFSTATLTFELPVMILASLLLAALVYLKRDIGRALGLILLVGYAAFLGALFFGGFGQ
ncbi:MAG: calcium/sodium antiporter [Parvularculaceae bacterium]|nr:calcium/sodium antiporter [Parvularculaceae bacterium]